MRPSVMQAKGGEKMSKSQSLWVGLRLVQKGWHPLSLVEEETMSKRAEEGWESLPWGWQDAACSWGWT